MNAGWHIEKTTMKEKFEGEGAAHLVDAVRRLELIDGSAEIAAEAIKVGALLEFQQNDYIVRQNADDDDVYLLIAGVVSVVVNGNTIAPRRAGQHVGEMAAIEPAQKRSADVVATEPVVALKLSSADFRRICEQHPKMWLYLAKELARRLFARNRDIPVPNANPRLFIISSKESLEVAQTLQVGLEHVSLPTVWTDGVFFAGGFALEALEKQVATADYAVAIAQPDDIVQTRGREHKTLRDNVLFELGLFMGKLGRLRSILIHPRVDGLHLPSDLHGLNTIAYQIPDKPEDLAARLGPACTKISQIIKAHGVLKLLD